jgi:hypothetical protein
MSLPLPSPGAPRRERAAAMSAGRSRPISRNAICCESLMLPGAKAIGMMLDATVRHCELCGLAIERRSLKPSAYQKRRFCGIECRNKHNGFPRGEDHFKWRGDAAPPVAKRMRAKRAYPLTACENCGKPGRDRHHKDSNTGNNAPSNIAILCRSCHMKIDGRLLKLTAFGAAKRGRTKPVSPCSICGSPAKPIRRGRCSRCSQYWTKHGVERPQSDSCLAALQALPDLPPEREKAAALVDRAKQRIRAALQR